MPQAASNSTAACRYFHRPRCCSRCIPVVQIAEERAGRRRQRNVVCRAVTCKHNDLEVLIGAKLPFCSQYIQRIADALRAGGSAAHRGVKPRSPKWREWIQRQKAEATRRIYEDDSIAKSLVRHVRESEYAT